MIVVSGIYLYAFSIPYMRPFIMWILSFQVHFGVNSGATRFAIEQQAVNEATFRCPDEMGWKPQVWTGYQFFKCCFILLEF